MDYRAKYTTVLVRLFEWNKNALEETLGRMLAGIARDTEEYAQAWQNAIDNLFGQNQQAPA